MTFTPDRFQIEATDAIDNDESVLVSAPTGSGKTYVAEYAIARALRERKRSFYTTPIKALSNQKYHDLCRLHGSDNVGLLTGDTSINGDAPIVVMTTEVLRNMIYAESDALNRLAWVVLDEVHYLQDTYRGSVWEEVIIHLPPTVRLVCLSATVSNADELAEWIRVVRGPTRVVVETKRPVELQNWYLVDDRNGDGLNMIPTLVGGRGNDKGYSFDLDFRNDRQKRRWATPSRVDVIDLLHAEKMLPVIYFIFSRAGCDDAVRSCSKLGLRFTDAIERDRIRLIAERHVEMLDDQDLRALGYDEWLDSLERGIASHHAGLIPPFKEAVERCFVEGLVKVVFATETLALGINMPARSVVIEKLTKFTGERHEFLTPAQFTQLTGRAGRRGIDETGNAFVLWSPFVQFDDIAQLAASKSFRLTSSFRPTYNMAANLVRRYDASNAHRLLGSSFAQYQIDADTLRSERRLVQRSERIEQLRQEAHCEKGDIETYRRIVDRVLRPGSQTQIEQALLNLRPGDVMICERASRSMRGVVMSIAQRRGGGTKVKLLTERGKIDQFGVKDFAQTPIVVGRVDLPIPFAPTKPKFQKAVLAQLKGMPHPRKTSGGKSKAEIEMTSHPVHSCPDRQQHLRAAKQLAKTENEVAEIERKVRARSKSLVDQFDRVLQMLEDWGYLEGWSLTERGERLVGIYHESDLAIAEAIEEGVFADIDAASVAGLASAFVFTARNSNNEIEPWFPSADALRRAEQLEDIVADVIRDEVRLGVPMTKPIDTSFFGLAHAWSLGTGLDVLLEEEEITGGDFVRTIKQLIDLLEQIADCGASFSTSAREAATSLRRGVVAVSQSSQLDEDFGETSLGDVE